MANTNAPRPRGSIVRDHAGRELGRIVGGAGVHAAPCGIFATLEAALDAARRDAGEI